MHLAMLDPETQELMDLDVPYIVIEGVVAEGDLIAYVGGGPTIASQVVVLDFTARSVEVVRESGSTEVDPASYSVPRAITYPDA